jgi:hypothetical protein
MIIYVLKTHTNFNLVKLKELKQSTSSWLLVFAFLYYLIQINFDLVSHNFGTRVHQFIDSYGFYSAMLLLITLKVMRLLTQKVKEHMFSQPTEVKKLSNLLISLALVITTLIVVTSCSELIINILWTLLSVNLMNYTPEISYLVVLLIIITLVKLNKLNLFVALTLFSSTQVSWIYSILLISLIRIFDFSKLHTITWTWITLSFIYTNQSISEWRLTTLNEKKWASYFELKLNNSGVEHLIFANKNFSLHDTLWGLARNTSNMSQPSFLHSSGSGISTQTLKTFLLELNHSITILDYSTNILSLLSITWLIYMLKALKLRYLIIF